MHALDLIGLLFALLLNTAHMMKEPEPIFRPESGSIQMGFCFGADYIVAYKSTPDGDLLLGNSSELPGPSGLLPANIRARVTITTHIVGLLGLEFHSLTLSDSGVYRRECWQDGGLGGQANHLLTVCHYEEEPQEIRLLPEGRAELCCNHTAHSQGETIRWYRELYPHFIRTLILDTSQSMELVQEDLRGHVEVCNNGSLLRVSSIVLKFNQNFYCMLMHGNSCISYQKIHLPETEDTIVAILLRTAEEELVLPCASDYAIPELIFWDTPFGIIDWNSEYAPHQVPFINATKKTFKFYRENNALVIPSLSENDSGQYKCLSPWLVKEYSLTVCPRLEPINTSFTVGDRVVLVCNPDETEFYSVQWYRRSGLETDDLLLDTVDSQMNVPEGLRNRLHLSQLDSSLQFSNLSMEDSGEYWCAVLGEPDYELSNDLDKYTKQCFSSRRNHLVYEGKTSPAGTSANLYWVCGALAGCVLLGLVGVAVALHWVTKRRASHSHRHSSSQSGQPRAEGESSEETACTQKLDPSVDSP